MFKLIQKDLLVGLKVRSLKAAIITIVLVWLLLGILSDYFPTYLPIAITYIVVMNSFYYDSLNSCEGYILSFPTRREDIVYSKYMLVLLILFLSNLLMYICFGTNNILISSRLMVLQDVVASFSSIMVSFSIIIPIIFKFGYKLARNIGPFLILITSYIFTFKYHLISPNYGMRDNFLMNVSNKIAVFSFKHLNLVTHDLASRSREIYMFLLLFILVFIFLFSIYISLKIYINCDID
ncbi:ABC-2 transporter permease [Clostridium sp. 1001275B_160808_H3]|uniref:ABC-2 transporter permease n=1 Tax=Clostridium sp. 1001275B_160808_H3 TaxID=2787110 RepID=UPI00189B97DF|nr:ABC-2 transporter permease [Clostridium sp. 1001275B_160808_H3]